MKVLDYLLLGKYYIATNSYCRNKVEVRKIFERLVKNTLKRFFYQQNFKSET